VSVFLPRRIVAVDFETTGITTYDDPMALACVVLEDGEPTGEVFSCRIRPSSKTKISVEALEVQGLDLAGGIEGVLRRLFPDDALSQKDAMHQLGEWVKVNRLEGLPCVAHKASFDMMFYEDKLARNTSVYEGCPLGPIWICTKQMAKFVWPDAKKVSLNECLLVLGLPARENEGHDALEDATLCGRAYFAMRDLLMQKAGVSA